MSKTFANNHAGAKLILLGIATLFMGACESLPYQPNPPVEDSAPRAPSSPSVEQSEAEPAKRSDTDPATSSLRLAANTASEQGDHAGAITYLERAVRIDPRNAKLWTWLSAEHLAKRDLKAASQHARKAIALANGNLEQTRAAWLQLAEVRAAEGKVEEAASIRRRYSTGRG